MSSHCILTATKKRNLNLISIRYNAQLHRDGLGAQLQRQVATFCLSRYLKVNFLSSEISSIDFNPGDGITSSEEQAELLGVVNNKLNNKFLDFNDSSSEVNLNQLKPPTKLWKLRLWFLALKFKSFISNSKVLLVLDDPYVYINQNINLYKKSKSFGFDLEDPFSATSSKINIAMHIPRAKVSPTSLPERYQPTDWYVRTLERCLVYTGMEKKSVRIFIHTDAPLESTKWNGARKSSQESQEYWKNAGLIDESGYMQLNCEDFSASFPGFSDLKVIRDVSPLVAWANISHCDIFILGKSSFSFIGALLNQNGIKITPNFFIRPPNNWITSPDDIRISFGDIWKFIQFRMRNYRRIKKLNTKSNEVINTV